MAPMVEIAGVSKRFGDVHAVRSATLEVEKGAFLTVVGPSGCGKTTLLRMIAGFAAPSAGEIRIHGDRVDRTPPYRRSIGMVFQKLALFPHMTAAQNVAYPLKMRRFEPSTIPDLVHQYLKLVRLEGFDSRRPHELSGGQQQRVAIARALVFQPDLLLLDEPLSALDRKLREEMQLEFRRIQQELGVTTINVTHDQREALVMSDQIAVMDDGRIQQAGTPVQLYRQPGNSFVAGFIGITTMFDGRVTDSVNGRVSVQVGNKILFASNNAERLDANVAVRCAVRAEQIRISKNQASGLDNAVQGIVRQRIFEGERMVYLVEVADLGAVEMSIFDHDAETHSEFAIGEEVLLEWQSRDLHAFPVNEFATSNQKEENAHV